MNSLKPVKKLKWLFPSLLLITSCVTLKDVTVCSIAGDLSAGCICAHTTTSSTFDLTFDQCLAYLEADPKTGKGAAVFMSSSDYQEMKSELQQACRELGKQCSVQGQTIK